MTSKQREIHLHKVSAAEVQGILSCNEDTCCSEANNFDYSPLPVSPQEVNLSGTPLSTVEGIWKKPKISWRRKVQLSMALVFLEVPTGLLLLLVNLVVSHTLLPANHTVSYRVKVPVQTGLHYASVAML